MIYFNIYTQNKFIFKMSKFKIYFFTKNSNKKCNVEINKQLYFIFHKYKMKTRNCDTLKSTRKIVIQMYVKVYIKHITKTCPRNIFIRF